MGVIRFNGISSADFGCTIERRPNHTRGSRRGELIEVPGRNGAAVLEDGSFATYKQEYVMAFKEGGTVPPYKRAAQVAEWLLGSRGFCRLEDDFEPNVYRMARYAGALNIEQVADEYGRVVLEFECQPQRYLKSGETPISYEGDSSTVFRITNPTQFEARPLLKFVDTSEEPPVVPQTLTKNMGTKIAADGDIIKSAWSGDEYLYTSDPLPVSGGGVAIITGISYAFYDSNDKAIKVYRATPYDARTLLKSERVLIPSGAATVIVGGEDSGGGQYDTTEAELSLQAARPNPGVAAVTINGTTINLDFSEHDTIFLDCDLHDAYYIDGSSANNKVSFANNFDPYPTFPGLLPGENTIIPGDGSNLDFELTPRWWVL